MGDKLALRGAFWRAIGTLASSFGILGYVIVGVFAASWLLAVIIYRVKGYDALDGVDRIARLAD